VLTGSTRACFSVEIGVPQYQFNITNHSVPWFISQVELAKPKVQPADDHPHIPPKEKPKKVSKQDNNRVTLGTPFSVFKVKPIMLT
jgi:hypothetical protein